MFSLYVASKNQFYWIIPPEQLKIGQKRPSVAAWTGFVQLNQEFRLVKQFPTGLIQWEWNLHRWSKLRIKKNRPPTAPVFFISGNSLLLNS
ncbi:hypothetical protein A8709_09725 [Paenibacillus pectinilyticus]|uniref:Uncharacterized protein n=1 Tax=Paenibacillus pectinilyticus TaxID=512399 RepID=A0A1C1A5R1_9BACL|nr:hypothetical protein A8709_09725 [Paenibacillus pectinilyticus]